MAQPASSNDLAAHGFVAKSHTDTYNFIDPSRGDATNLKVLISGASKGIGRITAISYARSGASAIALLARSNLDDVEKEVIEAARQADRREPMVLKLQVSTTDGTAVDQALKTVGREFGSLDVVINNASRMENWKPLAETDVDDWWSTWEVNLKGTFLVTRAALPLVLKSRLKTMIVITSAGGLNTTDGASAYQGSKTAQIRLNDFLVKEYGEQGLVAIAVHPGGIKTEMANVMPEFMHHLLTSEPELPANTLVWLTREKREWLSGRYMNVTWDMEELVARKGDIVQKDLLKLRLTV